MQINTPSAGLATNEFLHITMDSRATFIAVLVLQTLGAAMARPSDEGTHHVALPDANTILNGCPSSRPQTFDTPQQLAGDWCGLVHVGHTQESPSEICERLTVSADDDCFRLVLTFFYSAGRSPHTMDFTLSQLENRSWLNTYGNNTGNMFVGLSEDGHILNLCVREIHEDLPQEVVGLSFARCPTPGEVRPADDPRPHIQNCDLVENSV